MLAARGRFYRGLAVWTVLASSLLCFSGSSAQQTTSPKLVTVDRSLLASQAQVQKWIDQKDSFGPAYTAGPGWQKFMGLLHAELKRMGLVNITDVRFPYTRWYTTEFPDKSGWSLTSDGAAVEVAAYGTQSGSTGPQGVAAPMILYDLNLPVAQRPALSALRGKIVVVKRQPAWRCQKHPCTNTAARYLGNKRSGEPGTPLACSL